MPRTNSALQHCLLTSCVLKCLTVFSVRSSSTAVRSTHFLLSRYELASDDWCFDLFSNMLKRLKNMAFGHPECSLATTLHIAQRRLKQLLLSLEFFINDGACLIYEGNTCPGRSAKNSILDVRHKDIVCASSGDVRHRKRKQDLTFKESKSLKCSMEHDRLLYNGCNRQHFVFSLDQIDEFEFLNVKPSGWLVKTDPNSSLMIGGLRSPCMNACYDNDHIDRIGRVLRSYDGVFEFEREKEFFYLECSIHSIKSSKERVCNNLVKECRITRAMAHIRLLLDGYGKLNSLPRSSV